MDLSTIFNSKAIAEGQRKALRDFTKAQNVIKALGLPADLEEAIFEALKKGYVARNNQVVTQATAAQAAPATTSAEAPE